MLRGVTQRGCSKSIFTTRLKALHGLQVILNTLIGTVTLNVKLRICALCDIKSFRLPVTVCIVGVCLTLVNHTDKAFFSLKDSHCYLLKSYVFLHWFRVGREIYFLFFFPPDGSLSLSPQIIYFKITGQHQVMLQSLYCLSKGIQDINLSPCW